MIDSLVPSQFEKPYKKVKILHLVLCWVPYAHCLFQFYSVKRIHCFNQKLFTVTPSRWEHTIELVRRRKRQERLGFEPQIDLTRERSVWEFSFSSSKYSI